MIKNLTNFSSLFILSIIIVSIIYLVMDHKLNVSIYAQSNETVSDSEFHAYIEQMRGHISASIENKEENNTLLAIKHALHPIEEIVFLIEDKLSQTNQTLSAEFSDRLEDYVLTIGSNSLEEAKEKKIALDKIFDKSLHQSIGINLNDTNHILNVTANLIDAMQEEYLEAMLDGNVINLMEYQDGKAFLNMAINLIQNSSDFVSSNQTSILEKLNNIKNDINLKIDPSTMSSYVKNIVCEIKGGYYC